MAYCYPHTVPPKPIMWGAAVVRDQRLRLILSAHSGMSEDAIALMSDADGWKWVYANPRLKSPARLPAICFSGFSDADRAPLEFQAQMHFRVVSGVSSKVVALCAGPNPGPAKLKRAEELGIPVLQGKQVQALLDTGEVPASGI